MATGSRRRRRRRGGRGRGRGGGGGGGGGGGSAPTQRKRGGGRRRGGKTSSDANAFEETGLLYGGYGEEITPPAPAPDAPPFEAPATERLYEFGVLDGARDGHGFLRAPGEGYVVSADDPYVAPQLIRDYGLRDGVTVEGEIGEPKRPGQNPPLVQLASVCGLAPHLYHKTPKWDELTVIDPDRKIDLSKDMDDITLRVIDLLCPIGFGQRSLLVSPPRAGKTMILQKIAQSIQHNYPDAYLIVLLVDERPEEATAFKRATRGEVAVSTNDNTPQDHVHVTEMVLKKAKRMVETGRDVVILMDSLTRLGRAYNLLQRGGGRTMSGGIDSRTLEKPKAFFGAARNIEDGGSLTIIATALIETGSRMDQVIFEEFKGTGNMELVLSRQLAEQRIFPAIDVNLSGTRKEEKLLSTAELEKIYTLRRLLNRVRTLEAMELLLGRMEETPSNEAFLNMIAQPRDPDDYDMHDHSI
ncbi:MAG: transcription termination factor Rho [Planctomycetota bacterium]|nr:transcription termination factor Rho [Planctomycetota bacterium]